MPTVLTDVPEVQAALQHNIDLNPHLSSFVSAEVLDWKSPAAFLEAHTDSTDHAAPPLNQSQCRENCQPSHHPSRFAAEQPGSSVPQSGACVERGQPASDGEQISHHGVHNSKASQQPGSLGHCSNPGLEKRQPGYASLVLAADCVWVEDLICPFVSALKLVCELYDESVVLFAHKERSCRVDEVMLRALEAEFTIENVPELSSEKRGSISIMQLVLK